MLDLPGALRNQPIRQNGQYLIAQRLVVCRCGQEFFSRPLIKSDRVKFHRADIPPARQDGAGQQFRSQFLPDERLDTFRRDEILLNRSKRVGQVGKRANKMRASSRRRTLAEELWSLPECPHAGDGFSGKVVRTDEERIIVQRLSSRRLVVGVVQTNERISQERGELAARIVNLCARSRRRPENLR